MKIYNPQNSAKDAEEETGDTFGHEGPGDTNHLKETTSKQLKEKILRLQKSNEGLKRFVYRAAHDLKAPLASLRGLINIAKIENRNTPMSEYLHLMEKSVVKLGDFIHDLVEYSKNEFAEVKSSVVDFESLVNKVWGNHGYMDGVDKIEKILTIHSKVPFYTDPGRLEIIFGNMISNAIKYHDLTKKNPRIRIHIKVYADKAVIKFLDNGKGIDPTIIDKIFDQFFKSEDNNHSSGLGLFIVKEAVNKLRGEVTVKSTQKEKTEFTVVLPNQLPASN
ncbi:MAG: HAMP domain-containing sensor histidine kinase [Bacteroidetes bacterium]|nr:HAMP domain-containing sensor histidine kinase [Bacteroidota bacterium]MCZ6693367.1 HAMP domain-containing sensor histidine kinase [Bacteroidota bacterium]